MAIIFNQLKVLKYLHYFNALINNRGQLKQIYKGGGFSAFLN